MTEGNNYKPDQAPSISRQLAALEALLFISADGLSLATLQKALQVEHSWLEELLETLNADYESGERGLRVFRQGDICQLVSAPEVAPFVERLLGTQTGTKLSAAALEVLTIVAYRQPITRQTIESIRGVDSSGVINTLQSKGLIEEVGRAESVGHPVLFGTTFEFLHHFGLKSLKELPPLEALAEVATPAGAGVPKVDL